MSLQVKLVEGPGSNVTYDGNLTRKETLRIVEVRQDLLSSLRHVVRASGLGDVEWKKEESH